MKKLLLLFGSAIFTITSISQATIANQSFENWEDIVVHDSLEYWATSTDQYQEQGVLDINNSYQITPGYLSPTAIHLETVLWYDNGIGMNDTIFGFAVNDNADNGNFVGFPYSDTVNYFSCWYKSGIVAGDQGIILIELSKNDIVYSTTTFPIVGNQPAWTLLVVPLVGGAAQAPDSVFIGLVSSEPFTPGVAEPGSWLEIDEMEFTYFGGTVTPAPIPNNSFENWIAETISQPQDWFSFDPIMYNTTGQLYVTESSTAAHLTSSAQIETTFENIMFNIPSLLSNGYFIVGDDSLIGGSPFTAQPAQFTGEFQYSPVFNDTAWVYVDFWNATSGLHVQGVDTMLTSAAWSTFTIDLTFTEAPDSVLVAFFSGDNIGSTLLVDHLQFLGGDVSVDANKMNQSNLILFPNPANSSTTIFYQQADLINVLDLSGKLLTQYSNLIGNKLELNTEEFENGVYIIQLINNGKVETEKLIIQH